MIVPFTELDTELQMQFIFGVREVTRGDKKYVYIGQPEGQPALYQMLTRCTRCEGEGKIHGDSDQQMHLMQDTLRNCPDCEGNGWRK